MGSDGVALAVGAGGLVLGAGLGFGMSKLVSDGDPTHTTGLEGTAIGVGGLGVLGAFGAMPLLGDLSGGRLTRGMLGLGLAFGTLGGMAAFTGLHLGESKPARAADAAQPSYGGVVARNTIAGGAIGAALGGAVGAFVGYANPSMGPKAVGIMGGFGAAMFGGLGAGLGHDAATNSIQRRESDRIGTQLDELAKDYVWGRDENENGVIDMPDESRSRSWVDTESYDRDGVRATRADLVHESWDDVDRTLNVRSPADGEVDWRDVTAALERFDTNGTGGLDETEHKAFTSWLEETTERVVDERDVDPRY